MICPKCNIEMERYREEFYTFIELWECSQCKDIYQKIGG